MVHLIAPDDYDPDDALEARFLRDHDGAPVALELPHPEQEAYTCLMAAGHWLPVCEAIDYFSRDMAYIENWSSMLPCTCPYEWRDDDATPY